MNSERTVVGQPVRPRQEGPVPVSVGHRCGCGEMCDHEPSPRAAGKRGRMLRAAKYVSVGVGVLLATVLMAVGAIAVTAFAMFAWA